MRFLLTNDDGHDAPGLEALSRAASAFGEVFVAAPAREWSGCGHRVTTHEPIKVEPNGERRYVIHGTPADCVRLGLEVLVPAVDVVLSGINRGGNLGVDVFYSGTVAAAREASFHGVTGIAFSHYLARGREIDWNRASEWTMLVLREVLAREDAKGRLTNVNLPHLDRDSAFPGTSLVPVDPSPLPIRFEESKGEYHYRGDYHRRVAMDAHDVAICFGGRVAISVMGQAPEASKRSSDDR